jgi:hypothetical protein
LKEIYRCAAKLIKNNRTEEHVSAPKDAPQPIIASHSRTLNSIAQWSHQTYPCFIATQKPP